nr:unnamed protein product [Spirometra erinaceieuropaei]
MTSGFPNGSFVQLSPRFLTDNEVKSKAALKRLRINPANWGDLIRSRAKRAAVNFEAHRIAAAKAKCEAQLSPPLPPPTRNANA